MLSEASGHPPSEEVAVAKWTSDEELIIKNLDVLRESVRMIPPSLVAEVCTRLQQAILVTAKEYELVSNDDPDVEYDEGSGQVSEDIGGTDSDVHLSIESVERTIQSDLGKAVNLNFIPQDSERRRVPELSIDINIGLILGYQCGVQAYLRYGSLTNSVKKFRPAFELMLREGVFPSKVINSEGVVLSENAMSGLKTLWEPDWEVEGWGFDGQHKRPGSYWGWGYDWKRPQSLQFQVEPLISSRSVKLADVCPALMDVIHDYAMICGTFPKSTNPVMARSDRRRNVEPEQPNLKIAAPPEKLIPSAFRGNLPGFFRASAIWAVERWSKEDQEWVIPSLSEHLEDCINQRMIKIGQENFPNRHYLSVKENTRLSDVMSNRKGGLKALQPVQNYGKYDDIFERAICAQPRMPTFFAVAVVENCGVEIRMWIECQTMLSTNNPQALETAKKEWDESSAELAFGHRSASVSIDWKQVRSRVHSTPWGRECRYRLNQDELNYLASNKTSEFDKAIGALKQGLKEYQDACEQLDKHRRLRQQLVR